MNYIKEMNAFYNRLETNPLSSVAINLWYALMHVNNRADRLEKFTVAVSVLGVKSALSESTLKRARRELQEKGYIQYRSQGGNRVGKARWRYVNGILKSWMQKGITTVYEMMQEEAEFTSTKQQKGYSTKPSQEVVPDWFRERKHGLSGIS